MEHIGRARAPNALSGGMVPGAFCAVKENEGLPVAGASPPF